MANQPILRDPVEQASQGQQAARDDELKQVFDISNLKISDFKGAMLRDAQPRHPFDGYPDKKVQVGTYIDQKTRKEVPLIVNLTHIVVFKEEVKQDPSGKVVTLGFPEMKNNEGKIIRPNTEKLGTIATAHNRRAKDYESGGIDFDAVFDRVINLADGNMKQCCFIPSPSVRSQLAFRYNSKLMRVVTDSRYLFADTDQISRLRRIFEMIINPRIRLEESIRKSFDDSADMTKSSTLPGIPEGE
jgi:hypothetical protein